MSYSCHVTFKCLVIGHARAGALVVLVQEQILIGGQIRKIVQHILQKRFDLSGW